MQILSDVILPTPGTHTLGAISAGSVLFAGVGGVLSQDNSNFQWDNTNKRLGIGVTPTSRLHVSQTNLASGPCSQLAVTQTQPNATDTSDGAATITYNLSASSATNELVSRVFKLTATNTLTGGGVITNLRVFNLVGAFAASTTTTNADLLYIEKGTASGTVTTMRGIRVDPLHGTSQIGMCVAALTGGTNHTHLLLGTATAVSGNHGIYGTFPDGVFGLTLTETSSTIPDSLAYGRSWCRLNTNLSQTNSEFCLNIQSHTPSTSSVSAYEKCGLLIISQTADISDYTAGATVYRDTVGIDARGYIHSSNTLGRAWGGYSEARIVAGGTGDGYLVGHEVYVINNGVSQTAVSTSTTKVGIHLVADGSAATTVAIYLNNNNSQTGAGQWHKGLFCVAQNRLSFDASASFLELYQRFRVKPSGELSIGHTNPTYGYHQIGGGARWEAVGTPAAPTCFAIGGTGTSATYYVVATDNSGNQTLVSSGTIVSGPVVSTSAWNRIAWVHKDAAQNYKILKNGTTGTVLLFTWNLDGVHTVKIGAGTGGSGYSSAPTVTLAAPQISGGVQATAVAFISGGVVTEIAILNKGSGYITAPAVSFLGGSPSVPASGWAASITDLECHDTGQALTSIDTPTRNATADCVYDGYLTTSYKGWEYRTNVGATTITSAGIAAPTTTGTASNQQDAQGDWINYVSAATINLVNGWTPAAFTGTQLRYGPILTVILEFPAATDYNANARVWVGLSTAALTGGDFTGASTTGIIAFRCSTGVPDSNVWKAIVNAGGGSTTPTATTTGVSLAAATRTVLRIDCSDGKTAKFFVNGTLAVTATTNLPANSTGLGLTVAITNLNASVHNMRISYARNDQSA